MRTVLQPNYARHYYKLMGAITSHLLPLGVSVPPPDESGTVGGYYVWLQFPAAVDVQQVTQVASEEQNLLLHPGSTFVVEGDTLECQQSFLNGVRVCFVWAEEDLLVEGVKRLATVIKALSV